MPSPLISKVYAGIEKFNTGAVIAVKTAIVLVLIALILTFTWWFPDVDWFTATVARFFLLLCVGVVLT